MVEMRYEIRGNEEEGWQVFDSWGEYVASCESRDDAEAYVEAMYELIEGVEPPL